MNTWRFSKPDRTSPMPLWAQVLDDMRRRLAEGEFAKGFPPERQLTDEYEISRHTMREVMRRLQVDGLIDRERGRGTFLRLATIEQRTGSLYSLFRSIEDQGFEQRSKVLTLGKRQAPDIAERMNLPGATSFVYLHRIRNADDTPIAIDEIWVPAKIAARLLTVDFEHTAFYAELEHRCGVRPGAGWERVHPAIPDSDQVRILGLPKASAVFLVERYTTVAGNPLEFRRTIVRGDRYTFMTEWDDNGAERNRAAFTPTE